MNEITPLNHDAPVYYGEKRRECQAQRAVFRQVKAELAQAYDIAQQVTDGDLSAVCRGLLVDSLPKLLEIRDTGATDREKNNAVKLIQQIYSTAGSFDKGMTGGVQINILADADRASDILERLGVRLPSPPPVDITAESD